MKFGMGLNINNGSGAAGGQSPYLDGVLPSTCCDLDATIADSYTSGQTWANLIASPADGAGQTDYDFYLGADGSVSTDDPTFTGTPGDSGAYFAYDGGDIHLLKGANPPLFDTLHQSGSTFWMAAAVNIADANAVNRIFNTWDLTNGLSFFTTSNSIRVLLEQSGSFQQSAIVGTVNNTTDYLIIISWDAGSDTLRYWINTTTAATTALVDPAQADASPTVKGQISGRAEAATQPLSNGSKLYHFSAGNEYLDDTKAATIFTHLEARHGRDYTP